MRRPSLVIGYGNPLRADDGVGWQVAQQLAAELAGDAEILSTHQLTPELAEPISRARLVVFVDARVGGEPGRVTCQLVVPSSDGTAAFSHDVDPASLLELARLVYGAYPRAVIVSVGGADFGYGGGLSQVVQAAVPEVVARVCALLTDSVDLPGQPNAARFSRSTGGRASCTS